MSWQIEDLRGKLIVSCQALEEEPLHGSEFMARMALAAYQGGAAAIRANSPQDIRCIKQRVPLPIIGIYKKEPINHEVYITPNLEMAKELAEAGADIIALDGTSRLNEDGIYTRTLIPKIRESTGKIIMVDIATLEEAKECIELGAQIISTTLSGYTESTKLKGNRNTPDYALIRSIRQHFPDVLINAEGRLTTNRQVYHALKCGASFVTVGTAITRPQWITQQITNYLKNREEEKTNGN